ncbi:MAG: phosphodiester glycosidase family protein, partial [Gemmatimonadales bacterium]
ADLRAGAWTVDSAPPHSSLALNVGQFSGIVPWGWVVLDGREIRPPGEGPLSTAVALGADGRVHWLQPDSIGAFRRDHAVVAAFQSYPSLLVGDGEVPIQLREPGFPVQLDHRDGRLAIGQGRDGSILIALTRFDGLDGAVSSLPFGLTTPEMAAVMGALGCRRAVALDGGLSAQLLIRGADGRPRVWHGLRSVPMGLVATPLAPDRASP